MPDSDSVQTNWLHIATTSTQILGLKTTIAGNVTGPLQAFFIPTKSYYKKCSKKILPKGSTLKKGIC